MYTREMATFQSEPERWQAVIDRDLEAADSFVYAVTTTGIYCRPGCASRRPKRQNVQFFERPSQAATAGYRPCQRCQPDKDGPATEIALIAAACRTIENSEEEPSLATLASAAGYSPSHFHRQFKRITGVTPKLYAQAHRRRQVRQNLRDGRSVTESMQDAGYGASSRFYAEAKDILGMIPSVYRAGGPGRRIYFAVGECYLGTVVVGATEKGICAVEFVDSAADGADYLRKRFPKATIEPMHEELDSYLQAVLAYIDMPTELTDLPLDIQGTTFQMRVWQALQDLPIGSTASYGEIARRIGQPGASRAVAQACGANPVAVLIPCHRVIRSDGQTGGYQWGESRKRKLLAQERIIAEEV